MKMVRNCAAQGILAAVLLVAVGAGCAGEVTYYDEDHHDYHRWNNREVVVYRSYWDSRREPYREYSSLNKDEQRDYWKWRHDHH